MKRIGSLGVLSLLAVFIAAEVGYAAPVNLARLPGVTYDVMPGNWSRKLMEYANWAAAIDPDLIRYFKYPVKDSALMNDKGEKAADLKMEKGEVTAVVVAEKWTGAVKTSALLAKDDQGKPVAAEDDNRILDDKKVFRGRAVRDAAGIVREIMLVDPQGNINGERKGILNDGKKWLHGVRYVFGGSVAEEKYLTVRFDLKKAYRIDKVSLSSVAAGYCSLEKMVVAGSRDGIVYETLAEVPKDKLTPPVSSLRETTVDTGGKELRYLQVTGWTNAHIDFAEVEIWGEG